ncbi:hypothetical protein [Nonomuraea sp. NPDC046570]|uniref:hypothetical protein n=1 Tax=Nonomuraea sp. NPDC046570 TaxID=3155255 RepID=UPI0033C79A5D
MALTTAAFPTASAVASVPRSEPARPLTILLSNDDGYSAPGVSAVVALTVLPVRSVR